MYDVITIGSATRDVFLISDDFVALKSKKFATGVGECVSLGSKVEIDELVLTTGGGATNAAATFGSLGFNTAVMTRVGDDPSGKDVVAELSRFGVSTHLVRAVKKGQTGFSTLLTMKDGERTVLVYRGVSASFSWSDIRQGELKKTKWVYLTSLGGNVALSKRIIRAARNAGAKVMWNPGSRELKAGMNVLSPVLDMVDVLNMNKEEAQLLTKKKTMKTMTKALHSDGMVRLITDGIGGSYAARDKSIVHAGTTNAKAISRTGAGDAFGSGFLSGLIKTDDLREALRIATLSAESVIQKHGAKNGILARWPSAAKRNKIKVQSL
jgi:sugar/nucleoside kinase (ribokinase family)